MLLIDDRQGSGDLLPLLKPLGVPALIQRMEFGDVSFVGNGPGGHPHLVGIECKTIGDVVNCMTTGRFAAHQLPGLARDFNEYWLVIEGRWRPDPRDGILKVYHPQKQYWFDMRSGGRRWMWKEVQGWVNTMMVLGGLRVWQTEDHMETARFIASLYHWWCDKQFDQHSSLKTFVDYKAQVSNRSGSSPLSPPTFERRVFKEFPGLGWERSWEAERAFPNLITAVQADEESWTRIDGIGGKTAKKIYRAIRGLK